MNASKFSRSLYNKHDASAKETAQHFLAQRNYNNFDNTECYGKYDFTGETFFTTHKFEVEVKTAWKGITFPFQTIDVAGRKSKSEADFFIQINQSHTSLLFCPMSVVHKSDQYRKNTIYSTNELFYSINPKHVEFYNVKDGKWVIS